MAFEPYVQNISRYARTFDPLMPNAFVAPFFFMAAGTTGVAGDVVQYGAADDTVTTAVSGVKQIAIAGFLMQKVSNLDAGSLKGWRNPNNSEANLGDNIGVLQSNGPAMTKRYVGTVARGNQLVVERTGTGQLEATYALAGGDVMAVVEASTTSATPTIEPSQYGSAISPDFIRIRITAF